MPTLNWIGKDAVVNHHRHVPYRLLHCDKPHSAGDPDAGNLLVQGDNLEALKALLPYYAGKVKCIYIDPPYNTGNENWIYNDNVNSPQIRKWLGQLVKGEAEDLTRHDKWLCMMYPRLALLREFLTIDGVVIISIDDFEAHRLREVIGEIFGPQNFIAQLVWDKTRKNDAKLFSVGHEYALVFARSLPTLRERKTIWREQKPGTKEILDEWRRLKENHGDDLTVIQNELRAWFSSLARSHPSKKLSRHNRVDRNGPWRDRDISWPGGGGPRYDVIHPVTKIACEVPPDGWRFSKPEEMDRQIKLGLVEFREDHSRPPFRKSHLIPLREELEAEMEDNVEDADDEDAGLSVMPSIISKQAQVSVKLQKQMFGGKKVFPNPKDHEVIARLITYVTKPDDLILDSFAGSGTTGHAVLQMNKADGGNRRFICIEMDETIARDVTAQRLKKVVKGYTNAKGDVVPPLGGGFRYCTLGKPLFDEYGSIDPDVTFADLAAHVFFTETGSPIPKRATGKSPLLGVHSDAAVETGGGRAVYLLFNGVLGDRRPAGGNVLTRAVLDGLPPHPNHKAAGGPSALPGVVYGEACRLSPATLAAANVTFKQVPWEVKVG